MTAASVPPMRVSPDPSSAVMSCGDADPWAMVATVPVSAAATSLATTPCDTDAAALSKARAEPGVAVPCPAISDCPARVALYVGDREPLAEVTETPDTVTPDDAETAPICDTTLWPVSADAAVTAKEPSEDATDWPVSATPLAVAITPACDTTLCPLSADAAVTAKEPLADVTDWPVSAAVTLAAEVDTAPWAEETDWLVSDSAMVESKDPRAAVTETPVAVILDADVITPRAAATA